MADRGYADADQVVGGQLRQHFAIDIVVAECRRVSFEPQPAQPRHYVHAVILGSEERQPLMNEDILLPVDLPAEAAERQEWGIFAHTLRRQPPAAGRRLRSFAVPGWNRDATRSRDLCGHARDCRVADEAVRRARPWACRRLAHVNSSS